MIAEIISINYPKVSLKKDGKTNEYEVEEFVQESFLKKGVAEITFNAVSKKISFVRMEQTEETENKGNADKKDIVNISGKDFMTYEGLLKKAHIKDPNFSMVILESFVSEDMKRAWCKIRLTSGPVESFQTFDGFGSSTPDNTGTMTQSHPVEMAHTRAKGRALRDFLNIGLTMAEELKR